METKYFRLRTPVELGSRFDDWQVCWLGAAKNFTDIESYLAKSVGALSVAHQSTGLCKFANIVDRCNLVICREPYDPLARV
jgi:hypothetical protein